jgi:SAM-dependent methyltransferase
MSIANLDQAHAWDGDEGLHWTEHDERYNAAARPYHERLFAAARIEATDSVLDIGCGCGDSTRAAGRQASAGRALGVDLSGVMLARARALTAAEGLTHVSFEQADAQVHPFVPDSFDVAISRFGAMFFADQRAAFANIGRAIRPGGRLALVAWQGLAANEWLVAIRGSLAAGRELPTPPPGTPGPFGLADAAAVTGTLLDAGFTDVEVAECCEPFVLGVDTEDAFEFIRGVGIVQGLVEDLDARTRDAALEELHTTIATHATADGVAFGSATWLITASRA